MKWTADELLTSAGCSGIGELHAAMWAGVNKGANVVVGTSYDECTVWADIVDLVITGCWDVFFTAGPLPDLWP